MKKTLLILILFFVCKIQSQTKFTQSNESKIKDILLTKNTFCCLNKKLDSLKFTFKDPINNFVNVNLNRDIDFNYQHKRIYILFESNGYQIDLITKNDTIYFKSLKTEYSNIFTFRSQNENKLKILISLRNKLYNSKKNIKNLSEEITRDVTYGMNCGEGMNFTEEGIEINNLVEEENLGSLAIMLANYNCERQSFAVLGFSLLKQKNVEIPEKYSLIIEYIIKRNSELQTCSGCLSGLIEKIY